MEKKQPVQRGWCVRFAGRGACFIWPTFSGLRGASIAKFLTGSNFETWKEARAKGYRAVKIEVREQAHRDTGG